MPDERASSPFRLIPQHPFPEVRTVSSKVGRLTSILGSYHFPTYLLKQGAFAPPALPGFTATTPLSAIRGADSIPRGIIVARLACLAPPRTSLVARPIATLRAVTTTPVEPSDACLARFSDGIGLHRYYGESASTTTFRGLLSVHSHYGPQSPLTSFEAVSRSASAHLNGFAGFDQGVQVGAGVGARHSGTAPGLVSLPLPNAAAIAPPSPCSSLPSGVPVLVRAGSFRHLNSLGKRGLRAMWAQALMHASRIGAARVGDFLETTVIQIKRDVRAGAIGALG